MDVLIIEDEKAAARNLQALLGDIAPELNIIQVLDSVTDTLHWFHCHPLPDLIFMDIHLADGSSFEIFEHMKLTSPVIFTTAYNEYALNAFKVNSIDYLLKPIGRRDMEKALEKFYGLYKNQPAPVVDYEQLIRTFRREEKYKTHFLVPVKGDKLLPLPVEEVLFFYKTDGMVKAVTLDKKEYLFTQTLDELDECLHPDLFFRINRQYLISRKAVKDIDLWFNSRLSINLQVPQPEKILISKARVSEFKDWFTNS